MEPTPILEETLSPSNVQPNIPLLPQEVIVLTQLLAEIRTGEHANSTLQLLLISIASRSGSPNTQYRLNLLQAQLEPVVSEASKLAARRFEEVAHLRSDLPKNNGDL
jgi:hypothetical protein